MDVLKAEKQRIQHELKREVQDERERLYVLRPPPAHSTRSDVWRTTYFVHHRSDLKDESHRVTFQSQGRVNEFAACVRCKTVWAHSPTTGTKTLKQHKCPGLVAPVAAALTAAAPVAADPIHEQATQARLSLNDKLRVTDALADFCAQDLLPCNTVAGQGFMHMIQTVLDVAARYSKRLLADDLLSKPIDVGENVAMRASSGRTLLQRKLQTHLSTGVYSACSVDLWNDDVKQIAYLSIAIHCITEQFELADCTLQVKTIRDELSCSMVTKELYDGLVAFGLDQFIKEQFVIITDSKFIATEINSTPSPMLYEWHPSVVHEAENFLGRVFVKCDSSSDSTNQQQPNAQRRPPYYRYYDKAPELFNMIDDCKDLVAFFEHANLQQRLSKPLKWANTASWSSLLQCLISVDEMRSEIVDVLKETGKKIKIVCIKEDALRELIAFLNEFKVMAKSLEKCNVPTTHEVVYWRHRLLAHLSVIDSEEAAARRRGDGSVTADSEPIASLKRFFKPIIDEAVLVLKPIHIVAALLDPAQKHRVTKFGISEEQIEAGCCQLKKLMKAIDPALNSASKNERNCFLRPVAKRRRVEPRCVAASQYSDDDEDEDANDSDDTADADCRSEGNSGTPAISLNDRVEAEFKKYMSYAVSKSERQAMNELSKKDMGSAVRNSGMNPRTKNPRDHGFPLLTWWKHVGSSLFPILARVARSILCIPSSSAKSRGRFSDHEYGDDDNEEMMAAKCSRLAPSTVDDLMFLRSNRALQG